MTEEAERPRRTRIWVWLALAAVITLLAIVLVPPMLGIGRYKGKITQAVSTALGRPVRLSSAELHLLPRPGFVLTDLTVDEDPAYGAEPVLHANTVTASIRLLSVLSGHLEINRISVDEASFNLVRSDEGRWNLDPLFRTAAARTGGEGQARQRSLPYLEATNSRINIKDGLEKLPFSLVNADVSFWQENPGDWRLRLRGQPARTDVSLDLADTGIVRVEARLRRAPELRQMPIHVQMEWREAQLGQLSRLVIGSDPGWRGDLTGEVQLDGTADSAQVKTRLSASGVHRAEFSPADPLDFDANCSFIYHFSGRAVEKLACDSPLGDGHVMLTGDLPSAALGKLQVNLQSIPVSAVLDGLRTLRSGISDSLQARGTVSGQLSYDPATEQNAATEPAAALGQSRKRQAAKSKSELVPASPLQGSLTIDGFRLSGDGLSQPIQIARIALTPMPEPQGQPHILAATIPVPAGGPTPLNVAVHFAKSGYRLALRGPASLPRLRELAHVVGMTDTSALDALAGDPATLDLDVAGPWLPTLHAPINAIEQAGSPAPLEHLLAMEDADLDQLSGTITLHNSNWKSDALAGHVQIAEATLHLGGGSLVWDPVSFSYGPVKGTASLQVALVCGAEQQCPPQLDLRFETLDAAALQASLLGAKPKGSVLSSLIARLSPSSPPVWPHLRSTIKSSSLVLGPVTLQNAMVVAELNPSGADISSIDARLLGGHLRASGKVANPQQPAYTLEGNFEKLSGPDLCKLLAIHCAGGPIDGSGKITLTGFTDKDLAASADGSLHFEWKHGALEAGSLSDFPNALERFDRWTSDANIAHNTVTLTQNQVQQGAHKSSIDATVTLGDPPQIDFSPPNPAASAKQQAAPNPPIQ